jgi:hypothetical protein
MIVTSTNITPAEPLPTNAEPVLDPANLDQNNFCGSGLKVHPVANLFPMIEGKEFEDLCLDIESRGLQNPITVLDGVLLDGRNRLRACAARGVQPKLTTYAWYKEREDEWIISQNLHRRSITPDQRAALVAKYYDWSKELERARLARMANLIPGPKYSSSGSDATRSKNGKTSGPHTQRNEFAKRAGVCNGKARQVMFVATHQPELLDDVATGKTKLRDAEKTLRKAVARPAKKTPVKAFDATIPLGKRQQILAKAGKKRVIAAMSMIDAASERLDVVRISALTPEERKGWAGIAGTAAKRLHHFAARLIADPPVGNAEGTPMSRES